MDCIIVGDSTTRETIDEMRSMLHLAKLSTTVDALIERQKMMIGSGFEREESLPPIFTEYIQR